MHVPTSPRALNCAAIVSTSIAAAVAALCAAAPAFAQQAAAQVLAPVVITGARFDSDPAFAPIGATVIGADAIRRAGVSDVNQAIRKIGGVYGRQNLDGSPDFGLDLRGFGTNSSQNLVVLVDGVRLSESEQVNAALSTIAIETVERIEIVRGGSSVLYGEGATGGVINIITKRAAAAGAAHGTLFAEAGQLGLREGRATIAQAWNGFALDASIGALNTDNYRDNNGFRSRNFSGGAQWQVGNGRAGVRVSATRQDMRLPGSLTQAQFEANPEQSNTPKDFGSLDTDRYTAFVEQKLAGFDVAAELSHRERTARASYDFGSFVSASEYRGRQTQFSPRVRKFTQSDLFGGVVNETVAGVDLIRWSRDTDSSFSLAEATQRSKAVYVRNELKWNDAHQTRVALGVRRELFDKRSNDPAPFTTATYAVKQDQNAWEVQASTMPLARLTVHAKAGQSYRVANVDDNAATSVANAPLKPQTSHDLELGASYAAAYASVAVRAFRHELDNEIFYDPTAGAFGANTNLDPTRRQGVEVDASVTLAQDWTLNGHYRHVDARFTSGPNDGLDMVMVPKNVVSARLAWTPSRGHSVDVGAQWVDSQRYGSDFDNSCSTRMASYTTLDARYGLRLGAWELAVSGLNLADKQYTSNAFGCRSGIYAADGRQVKFSGRYDF